MTQGVVLTGPRVLINFKQGVTHEESIERIFPNGVPGDNAALISRSESFFDLGPNALRGYAVTRETNGNILIRPEAVFGNNRFGRPEYKISDGITAIIALQAMAGIHETKKKAEAGWRAMSASERKTTLEAYQATQGKKSKTTV